MKVKAGEKTYTTAAFTKIFPEFTTLDKPDHLFTADVLGS